jgi:hypothetical protein
MAVERYPLILKDDYNALRSVVPDLPETYEKWGAEVQSKKAKARHSYEAAPGGSYESIDVQINGSRFLAYCEAKHEPPTVAMLYRFASEQRA